MKKLIGSITIALGLLLAFSGGVYAASNWINFEGEQSIETTKSNIDELLTLIDGLESDLADSQGSNNELESYYEQVIKELQEQFQEQLENVTNSKDKEIQSLLEQIQSLENEIANLDDNSDYVEHLESELQKANELVEQLEKYSGEAVEQAKD